MVSGFNWCFTFSFKAVFLLRASRLQYCTPEIVHEHVQTSAAPHSARHNSEQV